MRRVILRDWSRRQEVVLSGAGGSPRTEEKRIFHSRDEAFRFMLDFKGQPRVMTGLRNIIGASHHATWRLDDDAVLEEIARQITLGQLRLIAVEMETVSGGGAVALHEPSAPEPEAPRSARVRPVQEPKEEPKTYKKATPGQPPPSAPVHGTELLTDPGVKAGIKQAAHDSDIGGKNPVEQGGFILRDAKTGQLSVERWPHGEGASIQPVMSADGTHQGKAIVGSFHTHPNVGPGWKPEPSDADINFVQSNPNTAGADHFVVSKDTVYHIDNKGGVTPVGKTSELLK